MNIIKKGEDMLQVYICSTDTVLLDVVSEELSYRKLFALEKINSDSLLSSLHMDMRKVGEAEFNGVVVLDSGMFETAAAMADVISEIKETGVEVVIIQPPERVYSIEEKSFTTVGDWLNELGYHIENLSKK